eukprot:PhM_4_TR16384/c0_g1_i3/m.32437
MADSPITGRLRLGDIIGPGRRPSTTSQSTIITSSSPAAGRNTSVVREDYSTEAPPPPTSFTPVSSSRLNFSTNLRDNSPEPSAPSSSNLLMKHSLISPPGAGNNNRVSTSIGDAGPASIAPASPAVDVPISRETERRIRAISTDVSPHRESTTTTKVTHFKGGYTQETTSTSPSRRRVVLNDLNNSNYAAGSPMSGRTPPPQPGEVETITTRKSTTTYTDSASSSATNSPTNRMRPTTTRGGVVGGGSVPLRWDPNSFLVGSGTPSSVIAQNRINTINTNNNNNNNNNINSGVSPLTYSSNYSGNGNGGSGLGLGLGLGRLSGGSTTPLRTSALNRGMNNNNSSPVRSSGGVGGSAGGLLSTNDRTPTSALGGARLSARTQFSHTPRSGFQLESRPLHTLGNANNNNNNNNNTNVAYRSPVGVGGSGGLTYNSNISNNINNNNNNNNNNRTPDSGNGIYYPSSGRGLAAAPDPPIHSTYQGGMPAGAFTAPQPTLYDAPQPQNGNPNMMRKMSVPEPPEEAMSVGRQRQPQQPPHNYYPPPPMPPPASPQPLEDIPFVEVRRVPKKAAATPRGHQPAPTAAYSSGREPYMTGNGAVPPPPTFEPNAVVPEFHLPWDEGAPVLPLEHMRLHGPQWFKHPGHDVVLLAIQARGVTPHTHPALIDYHMAPELLNAMQRLKIGSYFVKYARKGGAPHERYFSIRVLPDKYRRLQPYLVWSLHDTSVQITDRVLLTELVHMTADATASPAFIPHLRRNTILGPFIGNKRTPLPSQYAFSLYFMNRRTKANRTVDLLTVDPTVFELWTSVMQAMLAINSITFEGMEDRMNEDEVRQMVAEVNREPSEEDVQSVGTE